MNSFYAVLSEHSIVKSIIQIDGNGLDSWKESARQPNKTETTGQLDAGAIAQPCSLSDGGPFVKKLSPHVPEDLNCFPNEYRRQAVCNLFQLEIEPPGIGTF